METSLRTLRSWQDLEPYGIICLTGEADALSFRLLCDLRPSGEEIIGRLFGGNVEFRKGSNWNSSSGQTSSVLLPMDCFQAIATMCLFLRNGYTHIAWLDNGSVIGVNVPMFQAEIKECQLDQIGVLNWMDGIRRHYGDVRRWIISAQQPHPDCQVSDRNVHQMTGRVQ